MKSNYASRAKKFLLVFSKYLPDSQYLNITQITKAVLEYKRDYPTRRIKIASGCSRVVICTSDYAIKIDQREENWFGTSKDELEVYKFALKRGFDHLFLPVEKYSINKQIFYIFPRIKSTIYNRPCACRYDENDSYVYHEFFHEKDREFLDKYIEDLHLNNISTFHGKPVIIDYACHAPLL